MKAKTKLQLKVVEMSQQLSPITQDEIQWAYDAGLDSKFCKHYSNLVCMDCGHSVKMKSVVPKKHTCPNCKTVSSFSNESSSVEKALMGFIRKFGDFQVIRIFQVGKWSHRNRDNSFFAREVVQQWISPEGKLTVLAVPVFYSGYTYDFSSSRELSVRDVNLSSYSNNLFLAHPYKFHPKKEFSSSIRRVGIKRSTYGINPYVLFTSLLNENIAETLLKRNEIDLLKYFCQSSRKIKQYWSSIKIALRNKYNIKNVSDWLDYLDLLHSFGKDVHSPKYICPSDFEHEHNKYVKRSIKRKIDEQMKELLDSIDALDKEYQQSKQAFLGLCFTEGNYSVNVLNSVKEFYRETIAFNHCVFTNKYFQRNDSLILSASFKNQPIETVEVSLKNFEILQSRGVNNKETIHHKKIIKMMKANMPIIKEIALKNVA